MSEKSIRLATTFAEYVFIGYFVLGALIIATFSINTPLFAITCVIGVITAFIGYLLGSGLQKRNRLSAICCFLLSALMPFLAGFTPKTTQEWASLLFAGFLFLMTGWGTIAVFAYHHNKRLALFHRVK